jgi:hypothetical protein
MSSTVNEDSANTLARPWRVLDPSPSDLPEFAAKARRDLGITEFQHDPEWRNVGKMPGASLILLAAGVEKLRGLLVASAANATFDYTLAGARIVSRKVRQVTIHQGPALSPGFATQDEAAAALSALARHLRSRDVVYCSAVPMDSPFHQALVDPNAARKCGFHVLPWGGPGVHLKIAWSGTVDSYLQSLGGKRRGNVKRAWQKFKAEVPHSLKRFRSPIEVDGFLGDACSVYAGSDRGDVLDLGPRPNPGQEELMRLAAKRGGFLGYVLYAGDTPIAYRYGFAYGKTYFAVSTAFDNRWAAYKPGSVIFFEMLSDIERERVPIDVIDLLPHDSSFKRDRANIVVQTQNFYLFGQSNRMLYRTVRALEFLKPLAGRAAGLLQKWRKAAPQLQRGNVK